MARFFNTAGPCNPQDHYMLSPLKRLPEIPTLIEQKHYFVVHAPRQIGKTTLIRTLAQALTQQGPYTAVVLSMEVGAPFSAEVGKAEDALLSTWRSAATSLLPQALWPPPWPASSEGSRIQGALAAWARVSPRPLVVFLDEIDSLQGPALLSVLRQVRDGYQNRPRHFPASLALVGLRDVRDYKIASGGSDRLHTASPFNIKVESLTLHNFSQDDVSELLAQHTYETGQVFVPAAQARIFDLTQGQPWLVNALARQLTEKLVPARAQPIVPADVEKAREILIQRQDTHLDSLAERLREDRVRRIIEPMLAGDFIPNVPDDDLRFVQDLGLVRMAQGGGLEIANPLYKEVIPRVLANTPRASLPVIQPTWLDDKGQLVPRRLLDAFVAFWKQHGGALQASAPYHEIAPHLVLLAFLHRVVNGGGRIDREYAIGRGRMDVCVTYKSIRVAMELKVWRPRQKDPAADGLAQLDTYLAGLGLTEGWLVVFDQRPHETPLAERVAVEEVCSPAGHRVFVVRA